MVRNEKPEDIRARYRSDMGFSRELEVARSNVPNPARGGSRGYSVNERIHMVDQFDRGERVQGTACVASIYNVKQRMQPYRMTGNKQKGEIVGFDLLLLSMYLFAFPDAEWQEISRFIWDESGHLYDQQTISRRLKQLHISRKRASTEAYKAYTPQNLLKARWFWPCPPPLGVINIERRRLVDFDEAAFEISRTNRSYGHAISSIRVRKIGHYTKREKITLMMAIEPGDPNMLGILSGSAQNPRRWIKVSYEAGTTADSFADFCNLVCNDIIESPTPYDNRRTFMWDNLQSHKAPIVYQTVIGKNFLPGAHCIFNIVPRPPYQPKYGPIQYIFCEIACRLKQRAQAEWSTMDMIQAVYSIAGEIGRDGKFDNSFAHCGY